jgi:hypothetical protein
MSGVYVDLGIATAAKLDDRGSRDNLTFTRRYLDPNRVTYEVAVLLLFITTSTEMFIVSYWSN